MVKRVSEGACPFPLHSLAPRSAASVTAAPILRR